MIKNPASQLFWEKSKNVISKSGILAWNLCENPFKNRYFKGKLSTCKAAVPYELDDVDMDITAAVTPDVRLVDLDITL